MWLDDSEARQDNKHMMKPDVKPPVKPDLQKALIWRWSGTSEHT